jgi:hypothetical protein
MGKVMGWLVLALGASVTACGADDDDEGGSYSAANVCKVQIACGYQLADQASCEQLFETFFSPERIKDCDACVSAEPCETQQETCRQVCSL